MNYQHSSTSHSSYFKAIEGILLYVDFDVSSSVGILERWFSNFAVEGFKCGTLNSGTLGLTGEDLIAAFGCLELPHICR